MLGSEPEQDGVGWGVGALRRMTHSCRKPIRPFPTTLHHLPVAREGVFRGDVGAAHVFAPERVEAAADNQGYFQQRDGVGPIVEDHGIPGPNEEATPQGAAGFRR